MPRDGETPAHDRRRFQEGDLALLIDRKRRRYLLHLDPGGAHHTNLGALPHASIIGQEVGCRVSVGGLRFLALRPTLAEYIQESKRVTQIVYPKDLGAILMSADIFPGATVVEAGLGSGALTLTLLRAVGPSGGVVSYEVRPQTVPRALRTIEAVMPRPPNLTVRTADISEGIEERDVDRVVLDLPEPWRVVGHAAEALTPGGILLSYLPTILQVHRLGEALAAHPSFDLMESFEVLHRPWHVTRQSVRPAHRMVAHTAFLTTARKCAPGKLPSWDKTAVEERGDAEMNEGGERDGA